MEDYMQEFLRSNEKWILAWKTDADTLEKVMPLSDLVTPAGRKPSLVDDAYGALKQVIRDGVLPAGYQGSEQEIADKLKMSRTPVHEALIRLQSEGLVKVLPKRGVLVCAISPEDMREIYDVIIACESTAAELLAALPESERQAKAEALDALNASMGIALKQNDRLAWAKADDAFHRLLMASCGNSRLARIAETILDQSHRARMVSLNWRPLPTQSVEEHHQIVEAIRHGLTVQARNRARAHRAHTRDLLLPLLERFGVKQL
jgi:DNA-binding GntR family transcriptional regulator